VRSVILTGFMGTGKSSVGRCLSMMTGSEFLDLDALIVKTARRSINDLFAQEGEPFFRSMESAELGKLVGQNTPFILATGGGAVLSSENREIFSTLGLVVNLTAPVAAICHRLRHADDRPLLNDGAAEEKVERMLREREFCYMQADIRIDTAGKKIEDVAAEILIYLQSLGNGLKVP
jgi:shikimate kinase